MSQILYLYLDYVEFNILCLQTSALTLVVVSLLLGDK